MAQLIPITHFTIDNMKEKKQYKMVQLDADLHKYLKQYCQRHGFQIKGFIQALVRQAIANNKTK